MRKTILFPRKRIASRALQEKSQVKTKCVRVGSTRLYAPMVPLAPHPCVRWWNTKEMSLKLTRLGLHSLKGGSSHQKPFYPVGQMSSPARLASLPKTTHPGGVDTNGRGTVFHPLNGSGAKGTTGRSNASRRKQKGYPKGFYPRDTITAQHQRPVVPSPVIISTGLPFLFRSPEPLFLLLSKRKSGFGPAGQAKEKVVLPAGDTPHP